ncbi:MAG: hypothetical protein ABJQ29_09940 [Luteolibacter sp.]
MQLHGLEVGLSWITITASTVIEAVAHGFAVDGDEFANQIRIGYGARGK